MTSLLAASSWALASSLLTGLLPSPAGDGKAGFEVRTERIPSRHLAEPVPTTVLLPRSYVRSPSRRYPVLYFLHDGSGDERTLLDRGLAAELSRAMGDGSLPEMITVAPRDEGSWWVDLSDGRAGMGTFVAEELVPYVDQAYRTIPRREARAALGISMGGYGALRWALRTPDQLQVAGGLSPALLQLSWGNVEQMPFFLKPSLKRVFGADERENSLAKNDLYTLLLEDPRLGPRAPELLVRCGTEDRYRLDQVTTFFQRYLAAMGVTHDVVLERGGHDWAYWKRVFPALVRSAAGRLADVPGASAR